jgi:hypothetical protein
MTDERVIAYLLGELTEDQSDRFEEELFSADEWGTDMKGVEDDLIDDYVRGRLSPERKRLFEENFLRSESRCHRVVVATALVRRVAEPAASAEPSWFQRLINGFAAWPLALRVPVATAALALIAGSIWWFGIRSHPPQTFATLALTAGAGERDPGGPATPGTALGANDALRLVLALPENARNTTSYQVSVLKAAGRPVQVYSSAREGDNLIVVIRSGEIPPDLYQLKVIATGPGGQPAIFVTYQFRVQ